MFKISRYKDAENESVDLIPIELENDGEKIKILCIEVNGNLNGDDFTFRFMFSDIKKLFKIEVDEEACLDEEYLLSDEVMFTYNGVTDLNIMCDIDVYRESENIFEFDIEFNYEDGNGIISIKCDLKDYLE